VIAVVHIHKTAGTTLAGVFKRSFGARHLDVLKIDSTTEHLTPEELRQMMDRFYPRLDSINAHPVRVYSGLEAVVPEIEYISFLRNPIERTASHYQYDFQVGGVDIPFEEWVTHDAVPDRQTRILAGPDASGEDAIALLPRFSFIGRSDAFDESLVLSNAGWRSPISAIDRSGWHHRTTSSDGCSAIRSRWSYWPPQTARIRNSGITSHLRSIPNKWRSSALIWTRRSPSFGDGTRR
jgi:hypothetical protein